LKFRMVFLDSSSAIAYVIQCGRFFYFTLGPIFPFQVWTTEISLLNKTQPSTCSRKIFTHYPPIPGTFSGAVMPYANLGGFHLLMCVSVLLKNSLIVLIRLSYIGAWPGATAPGCNWLSLSGPSGRFHAPSPAHSSVLSSLP
jgi:hypothetical protein